MTIEIAPAAMPAQVLGELVVRLGLPYTRTFALLQVMQHAAPASLTALVEVGARLGLALAPRKCEPEVLDAIEPSDLPAVMHFTRGGFGVLVSLDGGRFHVVDERREVRVLTRDQAAAAWSGVLVLVERGDAPGVRERGRGWRRLQELLFAEWQARPELSGARSSRAAAIVLAGLLAALIALAVRAQPDALRVPAAALAALIALAVTATVLLTRLGAGATGLAARLCGARGGAVDCQSVLRSPYATVAGVPAASIGLAYFGGLALALAAAAVEAPAQAAATLWLVGAGFVAATPGAALFVLAQVRLRTLCTMCLSVHAAVVVGAAVALIEILGGGIGVPPLEILIAPALLLAVGVVLVLGAIAPHLARADAADRDAASLARLRALPAVTVAELAAADEVELDAASIGVAVGDPGAPVEVVAFVHPMCPACGETLAELAAVIAAGGVRATIAIAPMKKRIAGDRPLCDALVGLAAHVPAPAFLGLLAEVKRHATRFATEDPLAVLGELVGLDVASLERIARAGHPVVERAAAVADRLIDGVPSVFVDRRKLTGPLRHLAAPRGPAEPPVAHAA